MSEQDDGLLNIILEERIRGKSWFEIQRDHGIPMPEAKQIYNEALMETASKDPVEMRYLTQLRLDKVVNHLWAGLEAGSFKHADSIIKALERLSELMDLNQSTIKRQLTLISDEETLQLFEVLKQYGNQLYAQVNSLPLSEQARQQLTSWPEWAAQAATDSVEQVVYAETEED